MFYILDENNNLKEATPLQYQNWSINKKHRNRVARTEIGDIEISTVFIGMNSSVDRDNPLCFETMVFNGKLDHFTQKYKSWQQAEQGHKAVVELVKATL